MKRTILIAAVCSTVGLLAVVWLRPHASSPAQRPNIILISIDTCRPDHLGCYGRSGDVTPHIDRLARDGVRFTNVISPVPLTLPAHCSMLTGTIPPRHGVHDNIAYRLAEERLTLAEQLRAHGYQTAGVVGAFVLDSQFGLSQGFDTYDDQLDSRLTFTGGYPERRGEQVTQAAAAWLESRPPQPFFLFVHYFDPHHPYRPPEPYASRFAGDMYAGEIAYTDHCIGRLINMLTSMNLYDSAMLILTGDHGEGLGEHGEDEHGFFIYHSTTKVPLIIKPPGARRAVTVTDTVALIDIVPTVLSRAGLPVPQHIQGHDLSPLLSGNPGSTLHRFVYSESLTATKYGCTSLLGVEDARWKYIQTAEPELYDLSVDPGESANLVARNPDQVRRMQEHLKSVLYESLRRDPGETTLEMDTNSLARLQQLGYVGGPVVERFEFETGRPDPKGYIALYTRLERLDLLVDQRQYDLARTLGAELLQERPDLAYVHGKLGRIAVEQGRTDEAIGHFQQAVRLSPDSDLWHNNLGALLVRQGRLEEAVIHFREAVRIVSADPGESVDPAGALDRRGLVESPAINTYLNLASTLLKLQQFSEALEVCRSALKIEPDNADVHYFMGVALERAGYGVDALEAYREAVRLRPDHAGANRALQTLSRPQPNAPAP